MVNVRCTAVFVSTASGTPGRCERCPLLGRLRCLEARAEVTGLPRRSSSRKTGS